MNTVIKKLIKTLTFALCCNLFSITVHADEFKLFANKEYIFIKGDGSNFLYAVWMKNTDTCSKNLAEKIKFTELEKAPGKNYIVCAFYSEKALGGWEDFAVEPKEDALLSRSGDPDKPEGPDTLKPSLKEFYCSTDNSDKTIKVCTLKP